MNKNNILLFIGFEPTYVSCVLCNLNEKLLFCILNI